MADEGACTNELLFGGLVSCRGDSEKSIGKIPALSSSNGRGKGDTRVGDDGQESSGGNSDVAGNTDADSRGDKSNVLPTGEDASGSDTKSTRISTGVFDQHISLTTNIVVGRKVVGVPGSIRGVKGILGSEEVVVVGDTPLVGALVTGIGKVDGSGGIGAQVI
ncbi:MAG: hypothetical protein UX12_C0022G0003 [Candidatus Collierbacteria bacterium GW2011_GWC1_45_47]|nr:MAG: hypothetical protein UX12_C0022G0003 [Candidatus Collierbacteria bacterium GW2011_GWC1_45_47]